MAFDKDKDRNEIRYARNFGYKVNWGPIELSGKCFKPQDTGNTAKVALKSLLESLGLSKEEIESVFLNLRTIRDGVR